MKAFRIVSLAVAAAVAVAGCSTDEAGEPPATDVPSADVAAATDLPAADPPATDLPATDPPDTTTTTEAAPEPLALPNGYDGYVSEIYADGANWMCKPGLADDVCARNLDATIVYADGSTEVEAFQRAVDPAVDCLYIYPTVSSDPKANSDLIAAEDEEISTLLNQAARLGAACDVFAPIYRQRTLTALLGQVESDPNTRTLAYDDVVDAFRHFIANDSEGRPYVLVGHSQGAGILSAMIEAEIDDEPLLRDRLVSAIILGASVSPTAYDNILPCASVTDTGCVVTYSSYRDTVPPPDNGIFGRTSAGPALCVNPVDPAGGSFVTSPYFRLESGLLGGGVQAFDDPADAPIIDTPFVMYPDMVTAECVDDGTFGYLQLTTTTVDGPRTDDVGGDLTPEWGMHLIDANVAMGNLVDLVASQSAAFES